MALSVCSKRALGSVATRKPAVSRRTTHIARFQDEKTVKSIDKLIIEEHNAVRELYGQYKKASSAEKKQELAYQMIYELATHSGKEEEVWYPAVAKALGNDERKKLLADHMALKEQLTKLSNMKADKDEAAFDRQVEAVMADFNHHVKDEEGKELPRFMQAADIDGVELGRKFLEAGKHAPTRPHTWAPDKEPINWLTNRMTRPLDDAADAIQNRADAVDGLKNRDRI